MRRTDKEIVDRSEIDQVIRRSEVCRLAFAVDDEPYVVPVSFGYDGESLFFHTAKAGRKIDFIRRNNRVCFEVSTDVRLVRHADDPCAWSFAFASVIGYGRVTELLSPEDERLGLNQIMLQYSGRQWQFDERSLISTRVWRIEIDSMTGKRSSEKPT